MNTEERQLAEMLHRVTPEPPRRVTVEDVAFRLASEPRAGAALAARILLQGCLRGRARLDAGAGRAQRVRHRRG